MLEQVVNADSSHKGRVVSPTVNLFSRLIRRISRKNAIKDQVFDILQHGIIVLYLFLLPK